MENKPKKKSIFNVFDIALILIAAALAVVIFISRSPSKDAPALETGELTEGMVSYTVEITGMQNGTAHLVSVGDKPRYGHASYRDGYHNYPCLLHRGRGKY